MIYLVSFPRAGSTWLRLFFEAYTGKPTGSIYQTPDWDYSVLYKDSQEPPILIRAHNVRDIRTIQHNDRFIWLIRGPRDAIASCLKYDGKIVGLEGFDNYVIRYCDVIEQYLSCKNPKMLIYYEDLVTNFEHEAVKMLTFAGIPVDMDKIRDFIESDDENFSRYEYYFAHHRPFENIAHDKKFFQRRYDLPPEALNKLENMIIEHGRRASPEFRQVVKRYFDG